MWAAVELWRLTKEERFHSAIRRLAAGEVEEAWDDAHWREHRPAWIAWLSYTLAEQADEALRTSFRSKFLQRVDTLFDTAAGDPYGVAANAGGFYRSSSALARTAAVLAIAWRLTGEDKYRALAEEHVHSLCGRNIQRLCAISNVAPESHGQPFHMLEWTPKRQAWMPGYIACMAVNSAGTLSRFRARRLRVSRWNSWFSEPCVGHNFGAVVATMILMEGKEYPDLIGQGALPGVEPFRPGLPFPPGRHVPWGAEPVVPEAGQ
jgi:hypothetical protein